MPRETPFYKQLSSPFEGGRVTAHLCEPMNSVFCTEPSLHVASLGPPEGFTCCVKLPWLALRGQCSHGLRRPGYISTIRRWVYTHRKHKSYRVMGTSMFQRKGLRTRECLTESDSFFPQSLRGHEGSGGSKWRHQEVKRTKKE